MKKRNKNHPYAITCHTPLRLRLMFNHTDRRKAFDWRYELTKPWAGLLHQSRGFTGAMRGRTRVYRKLTTPLFFRFY